MEWTQKYAPKKMKNLVGNRSNYIKLRTWLENFYNVKSSARTKDFKYITLLAGPPGVGKTSGIIAISKEIKFELIEFNASDQRNEKVISRLVGRETKTKVNDGFNGKIILLDEVDGIQGREDRGGLSALMKLAKESVHPIICTANDLQSDKIRSLKKSPMTTTLTFTKPTNNELIGLLKYIASSEGLTVPEKVLSVICDNAHGDIRGAVNDLENLSQERKEIPMNAVLALSIRDADVSIKQALRQIYGGAKTLRQAQEVTFDLDVDPQQFILYVSDQVLPQSSNLIELEGMYSMVGLADLNYSRIKVQHWKYLKYYFYFLSAGIRTVKQSPYKDSYVNIPSLILNMSRTKKVRAIRNSVTLKFGRLNHCSKNKINNFSLPYIRFLFEKLFELYTNKKIDTQEAQKLLTTIGSIHNEIALEEEEFIYLFNDPLYDKQTAAEEKKQKALIARVIERANEIRTDKILTRNRELNQLGTFIVSDKEKSAQSDKQVLLETVQNEGKKLSETKPIKKKRTSTKVKKEAEKSTENTNEILDTFDLEEQRQQQQQQELKKKNPTKKEKSIKSIKTVSPEEKEPAVDKTTEKESKKEKAKDKKKDLLEFTNPSKSSSKKKKAGTKNLSDFF